MTYMAALSLANMKLPGFPGSKRKFNAYLKRNSVPYRRRRARGGGREYAFNDLPRGLQCAILLTLPSDSFSDMLKDSVADIARDPAPSQVYNRDALWNFFSMVKGHARNEAEQRLRIVHIVHEKIASGRKLDAMKEVSESTGISVPTLYRYLAQVRDYDRSDWLPALLPFRTGRPAEKDFEQEAFEIFKADYLRVEKPAASACYERLKRIAQARNWQLPCLKTIMRKLTREIPRDVLTLARDGKDAFDRTYPAQKRDRSVFHALEAVNADGRRDDVFVKWPDGSVARPVWIVYQDILSGKILSRRVGKTENKDLIRLAFADMVSKYGIPKHAYMDNGRGFASKWLTGGTRNRYRFRVKEEDPAGIMTALGCNIHWVLPAHGQSKPIERAFRDLAEFVSKHPAFEGAYTGNNPGAKPENYGERAVPLNEYMKWFDQEIIAHNARQGRRSAVCGGIKSFDQVFEESYSKSKIQKATQEQLRLLLLASEAVTASREDGSVTYAGNRYWHETLSRYAGQRLTLRFDPEKLHESVSVYLPDNTYIGEAACLQAVGFNDTQAAREHARLKGQNRKRAKEILKNEKRMTALKAAEASLPLDEEPEKPHSKIIEGFFRNMDQAREKKERERIEGQESFQKGMQKILKGEIKIARSSEYERAQWAD